MKPKISDRQRAIYDYIKAQVKAKGYPPSVREIADAVGLSSPSTVHSHLHTLENCGYIRRDPSKPRAILICHVDNVQTKQRHKAQQYDNNFVELPLVGQVAAGLPLLAEQNIEESFQLPRNLVSDKNSFMLRVKGDSMIEAGIFSGDYVIVKQQPDAVNGDIVVALIDDEATVKTFYKEEGRIRLQPENKYMEPIYAQNPLILGKVTSLFRQM